MISRVRPPRLLPATIAMLAVVLVAKVTLVVRSAIDSGQPAAFIAASWASGPDAPASADAKPAAKPDAPVKPDRDAEKKPTAAELPAVPDGPPPMTDGEKALLLDLRERRRELDAREASLASRESMLIATEQKLAARVEELQGLQNRLESLDASFKQQEDGAWQGLVKVYETMKPRDAAAIFNDLGMSVLLSVIERMKEAKASAILAAMVPEKARDVTTQLALKRTKAAATVGSGGKPAVNSEAGKAPGSGT